MTTKNAWDDIERHAQSFEDILAASGEYGSRIAAFDWRQTPLGPIANWGPALRTLVSTMMASAQPMGLWYGPELTTIFNDAFASLLGNRADTALGQPLTVVWHDVWDDILPMVQATLRGQTIWREDMPLTMTRNGFEENTWWTFSYSPVRDDEGRIAGFLDVVTETSEAVRLRQKLTEANRSLESDFGAANAALEAGKIVGAEQTVLRQELVHRIKNLLAIVQAIVSQSIRGAPSTDAALESVSARLAAFGRAQDLLTSQGGSQARLRSLIEAGLSPYRTAERFAFTGPEVSLNTQQSLGISLALHELSTNATKYGALHHPGGRIAISWSVEGDDFAFTWKESGVPAPEKPARRGFGSKLSEQIVAGYFSGTAQIDYEADGIAYRLSGKLMPNDNAGH